MSQLLPSINLNCKSIVLSGLASLLLLATISAQALPLLPVDESLSPLSPATTSENAATSAGKPAGKPGMIDTIDNTLAAQLKPSNDALSAANQKLLTQNAQLQRQVNDLHTQVNVLVYESQGQLFLYGAFTVLISLLVGIFVSWLVFVRRERW